MYFSSLEELVLSYSTRPVPGRGAQNRAAERVNRGQDIFTLYKKGRYAGSAILSPRQASQSQQAACSTTPCSVWTRGARLRGGPAQGGGPGPDL